MIVVRLLTAVVLAGLAALAGAPGVRAVDVVGDDQHDRYVGTGGLLLPGSVDTSTRREVAACAGCAWRMTSPCVQAPGVGFDGQPACAGVVRGCPDGRLLRGWFRPAGGPWRELGLVCVGPRGPVTVAEVASSVAERVPHALPALQPRAEPARGVLAQVPVYFNSGQDAGPLRWSDVVLGQRVQVTARPSWRWAFGDGAVLATTDPGGGYPRGGVAHAYRRAGDMTVTCLTEWDADFTVDGLGPFPVTPAVRQDATTVVAVGEGRAVLTPAPMAQ